MTYKVSDTTVINPTNFGTSFNKMIVGKIRRAGGEEVVVANPNAVGEAFGYVSGGYNAVYPYYGGNYYSRVIEKFPFASSASSTSTGSLYTGYPNPNYGIGLHASASSATHGYNTSGASPTGGNFPWSGSTVIQRFPFASDGNSVDTGQDLLSSDPVRDAAGNSSPDYGYSSGGSPGFTNTIQKFPYTGSGNATDVGDLIEARAIRSPNSASSTEQGYVFGGAYPYPGERNHIEKFPFASDTNSTDVGNLSGYRMAVGGHNSDAAAYASGGSNPYPYSYNYIEKVPFAADGNTVDVGDLTTGTAVHGSSSSEDGGFRAGGAPFPARYNIIDKFPFASDGNSVDYGDLTQGRTYLGANQV